MPEHAPVSEWFRFCPRCGAEPMHCAPHAVECGSCGHKQYLNPAVAVAAFIVNPAGEQLFIRRGKDPGKGLLHVPGGFVDAGETAEGALCREVREETGLTVTDLQFLVSHPNKYPYAGVVYDVLDLVFVCRADSFEGLPLNDEVQGYEVHFPSEVPIAGMAFPSMRHAMTVFAARSRPQG